MSKRQREEIHDTNVDKYSGDELDERELELEKRNE